MMISLKDACRSMRAEAACANERESALQQCEIEFVNPIATLQMYLGGKCRVTFCDGWATLKSPKKQHRVLPYEFMMRVKQEQPICVAQFALDLAERALSSIGITPLHNKALKPFCGAVRRPSRVLKFSLSEEYSTRELFKLVVICHRCPNGVSSIRSLSRPQRMNAYSGMVLYANALQVERCSRDGVDTIVVEPRAYFADPMAALRDTLIHALDWQPRSPWDAIDDFNYESFEVVGDEEVCEMSDSQ
jgi:hypothetical protein